MSENDTIIPTPNRPALPSLPCPICSSNLLAEGFYNSCTETQTLREDNYPIVVNGQMYLEHNEDNFETIDHECDVEAYCTSCGQLLPWALYEIRGHLDGVNLSAADEAIIGSIRKVLLCAGICYTAFAISQAKESHWKRRRRPSGFPGRHATGSGPSRAPVHMPLD